MRHDARTPGQLRPLTLEAGVIPCAEGSALIRLGDTHVLCAATFNRAVPEHAERRGTGWVTAEYAMLPRSSPQRVERERRGPTGRTQEIQRLVGRSVRAVTNLAALQGWNVILDCDVLRADGSTRCASITGALVAFADALRALKSRGQVGGGVLRDFVTAVSVGIHDGTALLDLDYQEDSRAGVDLNLVMTGSGGIVEVQGTAEGEPFSAEALGEMLALGRGGCAELMSAQRAALGISAIGDL